MKGQPEFVPSYVLLAALAIAAIALTIAHIVDVRRERPPFWDAYAWRVFMTRRARIERWLDLRSRVRVRASVRGWFRRWTREGEQRRRHQPSSHARRVAQRGDLHSLTTTLDRTDRSLIG